MTFLAGLVCGPFLLFGILWAWWSIEEHLDDRRQGDVVAESVLEAERRLDEVTYYAIRAMFDASLAELDELPVQRRD